MLYRCIVLPILRNFTFSRFRVICTNKHENVTNTVNTDLKLENLPSNTIMPKNDRGKLRVVRYKEQCGGKLPVPSHIQLIVLGTGARGSPRSIMISTDYYRYLFNCGEGTQRIAVEYKYKLPRIENIFLTSKSWDSVGGLLGIALTLESNNVPHMNLHGPPQVEKLVRMAKTFNYNAKIQLSMRQLDAGFHEDNAMRVDYVVLRSDATQEVSEEVDECMFREEAVAPLEPRPKRACVESEGDYIVAYIIKPFPKPRRLLLENCVELNIPVGPNLSQLKEGKEVTLADGTLVHPDQVLSPAESTCPIIVVECPSTDYIASLRGHDKFTALQPNSTEDPAQHDSLVELIVHMTPREVLAHPEYQQWMAGFGADTHHLIMNEDSGDLCHERVYSIQACLNLLDTHIFPLLPHQTATQTPSTEAMVSKTQMASTNFKYLYRPKYFFNNESCVKISNSEAVDEARRLDDLPSMLDALHEKVTRFRQDKQNSGTKGDYPQIVFLGTGSSQPSKVRNVSSILLHINKEASVLLDCGEATLDQIYRHYGNRTDEILCKINCVLVSHMHADHHLGTLSVARARHHARTAAHLTPTRLTLLAPVQMTRWLLYYANNIHRVQNMIRLVSLQDLHPTSPTSPTLLPQILDLLNLSSLKVVEVVHCNNAFGFVIGHDGWTLTYSGDTMPCDRLVQAGDGCDVLIHEATMEDELEEEARLKTHSTTSQALDVGRRMKAKFTILTHFSQRYAKIPVFDDQFGDNVGVAFDNMAVSLSELPLLPLFIPVLKVMFHEEHADLQAQTSRYLRKHNNYQLTQLEQDEFHHAIKS